MFCNLMAKLVYRTFAGTEFSVEKFNCREVSVEMFDSGELSVERFNGR